ncbi:endo-1,4-beta-xylanase [Butyrivibrio sp. YAB3001]|uniref:endo-1,4-beta-xylanase n=1 Tax=Butyrivibrio sp. YAB3001 TaxID=1520812 RepID=UPI0008F67302|nr:endo-1,4-beta-xylanase [Butyrivibrio sp. YAB3001]SFB93652.1 endo-1,4-beta-xylanase [Butyrivibrio sp. YAB3001]
MYKRGKSLVALLAATTMLTFTACGSTGNNVSKNVTDSASQEATSDNSSEEKSEENISDTGQSDSETAEAVGEDSSEAAEEEIPALRDSVEKKLGCRIGCAITGKEPWDIPLWNLVTTHFNAVTLGNELKPDSLFGYSVSTCPGTEEAELNGETITVPKIDYSNPEKILNKFLKWNEVNPDREIKVRGHVLVWHSQTPEWFFHEDYDKTKPYVSKEEMDKRLEWYIREVLTHFTGEDSPYKDLFYGWDVVNEAVSDATGTYRSDAENPNEDLSEDRHGNNSSWWHVYQSEDFIINAFKYANKYAPQELELYYNDYNECSAQKRNGIIALLQAVKDQEGEPGVGTRISAMGMQGHYNVDSPSANDVETSAKAYGKIVGSIQITEWDLSSSDDYDGSEESKEKEYEKMRKTYNLMYYALQSVKNSGVDVSGITFWGTVDKYSWLQHRSTVGGGSNKEKAQCPLLFDDLYKPKPAFWVFAET